MFLIFICPLGRFDLSRKGFKANLFCNDLSVYDSLLTQPTIFAAASIGKLKILVPWKKLGWEPILISLEDVTIRTGPQDDGEVYCDALFIQIF